MYNEKVNEFTIDLLISIGPGVNDALLQYGDSALKALNMINVDLDLPGRKSIHDLGNSNSKEIFLRFQPSQTLQHAFDLFPDRKNIFVISGVSKLDAYYTSLVRQCKTEFEPAYQFNFVSNQTLDSTIRFVRTIPPESIVFVTAYLQDAARVSFSTPEIMDLISKNSPAPVFLSITDGGFKGQGGGIGGYLFSYVKLGEEIGRVANEMMNGKPISEITVDEKSNYQYMYDWKELNRWHLTDSKAIPSGSLFYNKETSFFELYKWYLFGTLLFVVTQMMLIIYLYRTNKRQRALNKKMQVTERMHRELEHTDRLSKMSILTASLSHELFQPLAAIRFTAQAGKQFLLNDKLDANKATQLFEHILEDESRATKLIRSVKSLMKSEPMGKENVSLNALIDETLDLVRTEAERAGISIDVELETEITVVLGDKIQLQQVLMNFIRNAFTAMAESESRNKNLRIVLKVMQDEAVVSVTDSGPGLAAAVKEKLFKPFVTTKKEGFGIGLALCKSLIEKHNGKIMFENIPSGGAMFAFSLPVIRKK
ncbi:MAG: hypothetical protein K1X61_15845 [Chitinophagales bacterium]|nr:hypothetical protein [Chitinophagales bacterium]